MKRLGILALVALLTPVAASADPFLAGYAGTGLGANVSGKVGGQNFSVWAGQLKWSSDSSLDDFLSFCLQIDSPLLPIQLFDTEVPGHVSTPEANKIAYLVSTNAMAISTNWMAAGLQLAIWNVLYDGDYSLSSGSFWANNSDAVTYGNSFLTNLQNTANPTGNAVFLNSLLLGQDQVTGRVAVTEPASLLLLGAAAAAVAARKRRRQNA